MSGRYRDICECLDWSITSDGHDNIRNPRKTLPGAGQERKLGVGVKP